MSSPEANPQEFVKVVWPVTVTIELYEFELKLKNIVFIPISYN
jgi:hypothetical protein